MQVIGVRPSLSSSALVTAAPPAGWAGIVAVTTPTRPLLPKTGSLPLAAALLVVGPVFLQAPWVRLHPSSATLFTAVLLAVGLWLERQEQTRWRQLGPLLVGFSGSWLAGCLFWGWFRIHPVWHLPIEAFALPLALTGLQGRWRIASAFYLASLLGTACTDLTMALAGVMPYWPAVLQATVQEAPALLHRAALQVLQPGSLLLVLGMAAALVRLGSFLAGSGLLGRMAAAALVTTLAVDGLFLAAALLSPAMSGLI